MKIYRNEKKNNNNKREISVAYLQPWAATNQFRNGDLRFNSLRVLRLYQTID